MIPDMVAPGLWENKAPFMAGVNCGGLLHWSAHGGRAGLGHGNGFGHGSDQIPPAGPLLLLPDLFSIQTTGVVYQSLPCLVLNCPVGSQYPIQPHPSLPTGRQTPAMKLPSREIRSRDCWILINRGRFYGRARGEGQQQQQG